MLHGYLGQACPVWLRSPVRRQVDQEELGIVPCRIHQLSERLAGHSDIAPGRMECYSTYLSPFAGTKIYQDPRKYGLRLLDRDLETGESMTYPFFESDEVDKWRLMNLKSRFDAQISKKMESRVASGSGRYGRQPPSSAMCSGSPGTFV